MAARSRRDDEQSLKESSDRVGQNRENDARRPAQ